MGVHIQLDDTRILQHLEYDQVTDCYVGFCLPIKDGLPEGDSFILDTFEDLQTVFDTKSCVSYAKLRTCVITLSNILSIGTEVACRAYLVEVAIFQGKTWVHTKSN